MWCNSAPWRRDGRSFRLAVFRAYYTDIDAKLQSQAIVLGSGDINYLTRRKPQIPTPSPNLAVLNRVWNLWKLRVAPTLAK